MNQTQKKKKCGFLRTVKSILPYLFHPRALIAAAVIILVVAAAIILPMIFSRDHAFITFRQNTEVIAYADRLHVFINETPLPATIDAAEVVQLRANLDGSICAFTTDNKELYIVSGQKLKKIADDVHHFEISASGASVAYAKKYVDQYALSLYNIPEKTSRELTDCLSTLDFSLSPDGQTVAYYSDTDGTELLMCYHDKKNTPISDNPGDLVGLSDDGKQIYAIGSKTRSTNALYSYNLRGNAKELGPVSSTSVKFNSDHKQIMFYDNGKTYISINGKEAQLASDYPLYMVVGPNSQAVSDSNSLTYPVSSLFDHVYTCSDGESTGAWLIQKNTDDSVKLASKVSVRTLDYSGKYLYYIYNGQQLRCLRIADGEKASKKEVILTEQADFYTVTPNRKWVYFTSNGKLMSVNGKKGGKIRTIEEINTDMYLMMSNSGVLYYNNGEQICACKNGRKGTSVTNGNYVRAAYQSSNSVVYIVTEDGIYTAFDKKQSEKVI